MERAINSAIQISKRIKNETGISNGAASVSYAAVHYILANQKQLSDKNILLLGVGEIGQNTVENLVKHVYKPHVKIANRSSLKAEKISEKYNIPHIQFADFNAEMKETDILNIHELVLQKIEKDFAGRFRTSGVRISGANFVPPNALKIDDYITELTDWTNSSDLNIVLKSAIFHHRFVWIHPFFDGNGRTARLAMNLILMRAGFPPDIILKNDRKKYYDALNSANNGNYAKLVLLILQALERSLNIYLGSLNNTYDNYRSISDIVEEEKLPYGQEYVSLLARKGKIDAFKEGRNWMTTKEAVLDYIDNRDRKRILKKN